mmetsp:Transcript_37653/g.92322  ORF Transcript_37653/g.92322 Transcript_37653/m.92322 type:complete len:235 (+) Transcript_37653:860-1564(+)
MALSSSASSAIDESLLWLTSSARRSRRCKLLSFKLLSELLAKLKRRTLLSDDRSTLSSDDDDRSSSAIVSGSQPFMILVSSSTRKRMFFASCFDGLLSFHAAITSSAVMARSSIILKLHSCSCSSGSNCSSSCRYADASLIAHGLPLMPTVCNSVSLSTSDATSRTSVSLLSRASSTCKCSKSSMPCLRSDVSSLRRSSSTRRLPNFVTSIVGKPAADKSSCLSSPLCVPFGKR